MTWFEDLTDCDDDSPATVRQQLVLDCQHLRSRSNGRSWLSGELEFPTLAQLRERVRNVERDTSPNRLSEVVANVQHLHRAEENRNARFQVASQFNLLEMTSPRVSPDDGIGIYEHDYTQGPACAIAAGAGTIFRNYFVNVDGQIGQSAHPRGSTNDPQSPIAADVGHAAFLSDDFTSPPTYDRTTI